MPYEPAISLFNRGSSDVLTCILFFCEFGREPCQHATRSVTLCGMSVYMQVFLRVRGDTVRWPRTKALPSMNEFTLLWIFASSLYPRPVPLTYQTRICKDGFISIVFDVSPVCYLFDRVPAELVNGLVVW